MSSVYRGDQYEPTVHCLWCRIFRVTLRRNMCLFQMNLKLRKTNTVFFKLEGRFLEAQMFNI